MRVSHQQFSFATLAGVSGIFKRFIPIGENYGYSLAFAAFGADGKNIGSMFFVHAKISFLILKYGMREGYALSRLELVTEDFGPTHNIFTLILGAVEDGDLIPDTTHDMSVGLAVFSAVVVNAPLTSFGVDPDAAVALEFFRADDASGFFCTMANDAVSGYDIARLIDNHTAIFEGQTIARIQVAQGADINETIIQILHIYFPQLSRNSI